MVGFLHLAAEVRLWEGWILGSSLRILLSLGGGLGGKVGHLSGIRSLLSFVGSGFRSLLLLRGLRAERGRDQPVCELQGLLRSSKSLPGNAI